MNYQEHQLGFIIAYLGYDILKLEESDDWFILYTSIPVLEKIGLDAETETILRDFGLGLNELSHAYDEVVSTDFNDMFNHVFITIPV